MKIGERIKKIRLTMGLDQSEFGKMLDAKANTVCNWETSRRIPRLPMMRKIVEQAKLRKIKVEVKDFFYDEV